MAFTPSNETSLLMKFLPGYVTDCPMVSTETGTEEDTHNEAINLPSSSSTNSDPVPGPSGHSSSQDASRSPEMLRPFAKAGPRKKVGGPKKRYSAILTSTP